MKSWLSIAGAGAVSEAPRSIVSDVKRGPARSSLCTRGIAAEARGSQQSNGRHRASRRTKATMILAGPRTSILLEELITWFGAGDGPLLRVLAITVWLRHLIVYCGAVLPRACSLESTFPCFRVSHEAWFWPCLWNQSTNDRVMRLQLPGDDNARFGDVLLPIAHSDRSRLKIRSDKR